MLAAGRTCRGSSELNGQGGVHRIMSPGHRKRQSGQTITFPRAMLAACQQCRGTELNFQGRFTRLWCLATGSVTFTLIIPTNAYDAGKEYFGYSALGPVKYTNQLGKVTSYGYDAALRKTAETNANTEILSFSYYPA